VEPTQRLIVFVMSGIALLWVWWIFLFAYLTKKPADIATNIASSSEQENVITDKEESVPTKQVSIIPEPSEAINQPQKNTTPQPLTILLPPWVDEEYRDILEDRLDLEFPPVYIQPSSRNEFLRAITRFSTWDRQADLMLIPREETKQLENRAGRVERRSGTLSDFFHPQLKPLLESAVLTFVPHALDPRVHISTKQETFQWLWQYLQQYTTPIQWSEAQFTSHRQLMQRVWFWLEQMTSKATIDLMPRLFSLTTDETCLFSVDCLTLEQPTARLPLSSIDPDKINTVTLSELPTLDRSTPTYVRWRVFRGNDDTASITNRLERIRSYIELMKNDKLPYEPVVLPAYLPRLQRIVLQAEWTWFSAALYRLHIFTKSSQEITNRFSRLPFPSALDGSYRRESYVEKRQEINKNKE
jgi:hypothetical protein